MAGLTAYASPGLGSASISERITQLVQAGKVREIAQTENLPPGIPEITVAELEKRTAPWYTRWWVWAIAGTAVVGGGAVIVLRRDKKGRKK